MAVEEEGNLGVILRASKSFSLKIQIDNCFGKKSPPIHHNGFLNTSATHFEMLLKPLHIYDDDETLILRRRRGTTINGIAILLQLQLQYVLQRQRKFHLFFVKVIIIISELELLCDFPRSSDFLAHHFRVQSFEVKSESIPSFLSQVHKSGFAKPGRDHLLL